MCGCGRTIRVSRKVFAEAPILCGACGGEFTIQDPDNDDSNDENDGQDGDDRSGETP